MFGELLGKQHVIVVVFGDLLEHNMSLLWCLENCWNATCHVWDYWRIAGTQRAIVVMLFSYMIVSIQAVCAN